MLAPGGTARGGGTGDGGGGVRTSGTGASDLNSAGRLMRVSVRAALVFVAPLAFGAAVLAFTGRSMRVVGKSAAGTGLGGGRSD